ncbi:hypothetical protein [Ferruginibacter sp.]
MKNNFSKVFTFFCIITALLSFALLSSSCKKETIIKEVFHDTVIIKHDSIITRYDVLKWMPKKWTLANDELEQYSGITLTSKKQNSYNGLGFYQEYKTNGTTTFNDLGGVSNGTWELLSDNYFVLDKSTSGERYYYILSISEKNLVIRGPFSKTNGLYSNFLVTTYLKYP